MSAAADEKVKLYMPRTLEVGAGGAAHGFVNKSDEINNDFELSPMVAEQSGVADIRRKQLQDEVIRLVSEQREQARSEGLEIGFEEGLKAGEDKAFQHHSVEIRGQIQRIGELTASFEKMKAEILGQSESVIMKMVYHLAERIARQQISQSSAGVKNILGEIVKSVQTDERLNIRLNPDDLKFIESVQVRTEMGFDLKRIKFEADASIERGGAVVESNHSFIDASVQTRVERIWQSINQGRPDLSGQNVNMNKVDDDSDGSDKS